MLDGGSPASFHGHHRSGWWHWRRSLNRTSANAPAPRPPSNGQLRRARRARRACGARHCAALELAPGGRGGRSCVRAPRARACGARCRRRLTSGPASLLERGASCSAFGVRATARDRVRCGRPGGVFLGAARAFPGLARGGRMLARTPGLTLGLFQALACALELFLGDAHALLGDIRLQPGALERLCRGVLSAACLLHL
jgi:hypothetical protein